jgi:phospholipid/cholesterol/gamma-HCH transport system ATP-binding protein
MAVANSIILLMNNVVEINKVSKAFGSHVVLDNVSLNVEEGENMIVFGQSGTGKSVLLKCIVRLLEPDKGDIFIEGTNVLTLRIKELNDVRKNLGFLFQGAALYDSMSVRENLEFPLIRHFTFTPEEREEKIKSVLEKVSLEEAIDKMPSELSGGMKKRIGLARSIITEPKLMLYDEPTTGLDPITSKEISSLILELQKSLKMTSIVVTHDLLCAEIIADRAIVLNEGIVQHEGTITELTTSRDPFLRNFFSHEIVEEQNRRNNV